MKFRVLTGLVLTLLMLFPGVASAAVATPSGDVVEIGDPDALGQIDLYVDPLCPYSGKMIRSQGLEIGKRIEDGSLRVNLRFVSFLEKYSASGTYDARAIYATFVVAGQSGASDVAWRFVQQIFSAERQPHEGGASDLSNDQLADVAASVGAPGSAVDLIRLGVFLGYDPHAIAASNLAVLHTFPEPGVPTVVLGGEPLDGESDWLARLPR
ncbi:serine/threonine protein kinase [Mycolicibacterium canariasense]|uniref:Serine/threonine protein kinase n=2 Tax=Mycolicibacterium canariasense TaxID=228230 RepID=A0A100WFQ4_MYCCR|nr:serine/threonine protein kinase [Mycolicibacterium canariasense]MCV7211399.1 serine/threonine protein kinase [Mycolicibacterium canariasense]GAS97119.1 serine/threonine protein kinase [Mycolicibacterium canariasense]